METLVKRHAGADAPRDRIRMHRRWLARLPSARAMPVAIALLCTGRLLCGYPLPDARGTPAAPGAAVQVARGESLYAPFPRPAAPAACASANDAAPGRF